MSVAYERSGRGIRRRASVVGFLAATALMLRTAGAADTLTVVLDQAELTKLPDQVATVVVGNPLIADVSVQAGGMLVVTGKGYGVTNLVALDRSGAVLMEKHVQVQGPRENVVVMYRGVQQETYSCTPQCERRITLGDSPDFFNPTLAQVGSRNGQAQGSAMTPAGPPH